MANDKKTELLSLSIKIQNNILIQRSVLAQLEVDTAKKALHHTGTPNEWNRWNETTSHSYSLLQTPCLYTMSDLDSFSASLYIYNTFVPYYEFNIATLSRRANAYTALVAYIMVAVET